MSAKKIFFCLFFLLTLLSLAYVANAQEDFKAASSSTVNLCPCSSQAYKIIVENTGKETSSYRVIAAGNISKWLSFSPARFSLGAGQKGSFAVAVNSECNIQGSFDAEIFIATEKNAVKSIKQKLNFTECYDYELKQGKALGEDEKISFAGYEGSYLICRNEKKTIPVLIENKESFANRYTLKLDAPEWAKLSLEKAQLGAKKSGLILINVDTNNAAETAGEEKFDFNIDALSELGKVNRKAGLEVNVAECYSLEVALEKEKDVLCGGEAKNYGAKISNIGAAGHEVLLSAGGPEWARAGNDSAFLPAGEEITEFLALSPGEDISGEFLISLDAEIKDKAGAVFSDGIDVEVTPQSECYRPSINAKSKVRNHYKQDFFFAKVKNKGIRKANYTLKLEGVPWADAQPRSIELNPGEIGNLNIGLNPDENAAEGSYTLDINLDAGGASYSKSVVIELKKENELVKKAKSGLRLYQYNIYLALLAAILLAVLYNPMKRQYFKIKQRHEKYKARQEKIRQRRLEKQLREEEKEKELKLKEQEEGKEFKKELKIAGEKRAKEGKRGKPRRLPKNLLVAFISLIIISAIVFFGNYSKSFNAKYLPIYVSNFFVTYLYYIMIGTGIAAAIFLLVLLYERIKNKGRNNKGRDEQGKKTRHKAAYFFAALAAAAAFIYGAYYFKFFGAIKEFFILYLNYFIAGFAILIAIILIMRLYKPLVKMIRKL